MEQYLTLVMGFCGVAAVALLLFAIFGGISKVPALKRYVERNDS